MTRLDWLITFFVGALIAVIYFALMHAADARTVSRARAFEMAFNLFPGRLIVVPQMNGTVKYLRTESRKDGTYAVVFQPMD